MALMDRGLPALARGPDLEVLFREARRRRRRRRLAALVVVLLAAVIVRVVEVSSGGPHRSSPPRPSGARPSHPATARSRRVRPSTAAAPSVLDGKYVASAPVFTTPSDGFLTVGGSSTTGTEASHFWFERTSDGGRRWTAGPATGSDGAVDVEQGFAFDGSRDGWSDGGVLYVTSDAGRRWRLVEPGWRASALAVQGRSTWIVAARCTRAAACTDDNTLDIGRIYAVSGPDAPLVALAGQPSALTGGATLVRSSPTTAFVLSPTRKGSSVLQSTNDGGLHWKALALPCATGPGELDSQIGAGGGLVWTTCERYIGSTSSEVGPTVVYRSADGGVSWERMTPPDESSRSQLGGGGTLDVVGDLDAWATTSDRNGLGYLYRTTDGGARWTEVLDGGMTAPDGGDKDGDLFAITGLTAVSGEAADVSLWRWSAAGGRQLEVDSTTDGGRTWHLAVLPAPAGVPVTH